MSMIGFRSKMKVSRPVCLGAHLLPAVFPSVDAVNYEDNRLRKTHLNHVPQSGYAVS